MGKRWPTPSPAHFRFYWVFMGTRSWTDSGAESFRRQVLLNALGPVSHQSLGVLLSPFSMISWDFTCSQEGQEPSSKVMENRLPSPGQGQPELLLPFLLNLLSLKERKGPAGWTGQGGHWLHTWEQWGCRLSLAIQVE